MTEISRPWQDGAGDGGPYGADAWNLILETLGLATGANVGVVPGILNELAVSSTGDNNITIDTGRAQVEGTVYENDASLALTTNDPSVGTTGRRLVLQKDWSAREVRAVIISSDGGVSDLPALTQQDGVIWEIPLASFTITTAGVIAALTDEREWTGPPLATGRFVTRAGSTRWTAPGWYFAGQNNIAMVADAITFIPIVVQEARTFDRIGVQVNTLAAGEVARLGIYNSLEAADGLKPSTLLLDAGTVSVATTGAKEVTISQALPIGWYFLAIVTESVTPKFVGPNVASAITVPVVGLNTVVGSAPNTIIPRTDANAGADWPNNGLPTSAPAVTNLADAGKEVVRLRDSS